MWSDEEEELLDGVEDEDEPRRFPTWARVSLAVVLAFVMVSYVWLSPTVFDVLLGWTQSDVVFDRRVSHSGVTVVFSEDVLAELRGIYGEFPEEETALCLFGDVANDTYTVRDLSRPLTYSSSYDHVSHEPCPADAIVVFHTHPQRYCLPSRTDRATLGEVQRRNEDAIMLIMCEPDRYAVVTDTTGP